MAEMVAAGRALAADPQARAEAREIAEELALADEGLDVIIAAERAAEKAAGRPAPKRRTAARSTPTRPRLFNGDAA